MPSSQTVPTIAPMLARLVRELPGEGYVYEPKWDGFRCLAWRDGDQVELQSRHGRPLGRYFPELAAALASVEPQRWVIDGEALVCVDGRFDFGALMARLHPAASRVRELAQRTPAVFVAFDLVASGDEILADLGFAERRRRLVSQLSAVEPPLYVTPATEDRALAERWLEQFCGGGLDGIVAKHRELPYQPGKRAMLKVKHERTAECVVAGVRLELNDGSPPAPPALADPPAALDPAAPGDPPAVASLLLGLYDEAGALEHIGVASSFTRERRVALAHELMPLAVPLDGHPWERGFLLGGGHMGRLKGAAGRWAPGMTLDWVPLAPERVAEVSYTQVDGRRLRHPGKLVRWRPDRDPASCRIDQLDSPPPPSVL
jgi:ATP-dependent DNA ligase